MQCKKKNFLNRFSLSSCVYFNNSANSIYILKPVMQTHQYWIARPNKYIILSKTNLGKNYPGESRGI